MNYSAVALILLTTYLWYANSLQNEFQVIKKFLIIIYETMESKFDQIINLLNEYHENVLTGLDKIQNMTKHSIDLILINSNKIDVINNKIDSLVNK
ncbi:gp16 [Alphabaculovirus alterspexiguae]|uniref:Gp16 n=1 Tax=Spodoptera exigua multiple nucleopolyhedrovirus TaxID=10454 RepID=A0A3G2JTU8_9ABAC|nr:gp16 [Spodoptera exigua multiple nucleopolyhedrovirus]AYN44968.1 gp16 [Spodoptera exigua multiple nucleopolyhedrovirus]